MNFRLRTNLSSIRSVFYGVVVAGLVCGTAGCSFGGGSTAKIVPVAEAKGKTDASALPPDWVAANGRQGLYKYEGADSPPLYLTTVKDCPASADTSLPASYRQILVGFSNINIISQREVDLGNKKALRSITSATLDDAALILGGLTFKEEKCVFDVSLWTPAAASSEGTPAIEARLDELQRWFSSASVRDMFARRSPE